MRTLLAANLSILSITFCLRPVPLVVKYTAYQQQTKKQSLLLSAKNFPFYRVLTETGLVIIHIRRGEKKRLIA